MRRLVLIFLAGVAAFASGATPASAAPPFDGTMSFQSITDPSGPEEFSWTVSLGIGQELKLIDDRHAGVYFGGAHLAVSITAVPAHDRNGLGVDGDGFMPHAHGAGIGAERKHRVLYSRP